LHINKRNTNFAPSKTERKVSNSLKNKLQWLFLILSVVLIALFLYFSNRLVQSLGQEERTKMEIWADAYRQLLLADENADMTLELKVMASNTTIPVFYTDDEGELLGWSNMDIPADTVGFIKSKIDELTLQGHYFDIEIVEGLKQRLYYDESILLQQLHYYPYIQLMVIIVFLLLLYYMLHGKRISEQNRVWVGLSKETAHQLGTPIQSLMGWTEYLAQSAEDQSTFDSAEIKDAVIEMDKDIQRLRIVADRFSKIGSEPKLEETDLCEVIQNVAEYMQKRVSNKIFIDAQLPEKPVMRMASGPLLSWVIENLCKNAVDAQPTQVRIRLNADAIIEVEDDGKGIPKNKQKKIFEPGYTTKKRGWGLGLALVKRIIEQYHHGKIYVKSSIVGVGTTFRIEL
jgi:signal transduction histidine kinase